MEDRKGLVSVSYLITRGWTGKSIKAKLGAPDKFSHNPHFTGAPNVRLYNMKRVKVAEKSEWFTKYLKQRKRSTESVDVSEFFS